MKLFPKILLGVLVVFFAIPPAVAHMQNTTSALSPLRSVGGTIVTVIPCSGGMLHITIKPAGLFPFQYIWTPVTITKLYGPPISPLQQFVGLVDLPFVCFIGGGFFTSPFPLFGWRLNYIGTSAPGANPLQRLLNIPTVPVIGV